MWPVWILPIGEFVLYTILCIKPDITVWKCHFSCYPVDVNVFTQTTTTLLSSTSPPLIVVNKHSTYHLERMHALLCSTILLTHWSRDKMATIFQTTFSNAFSWMKMMEFRLEFQCNLFQGSNWQYASTGSDNGLAPYRRQAIIWTNFGLVYRPIYASLGLNEQSKSSANTHIRIYAVPVKYISQHTCSYYMWGELWVYWQIDW